MRRGQYVTLKNHPVTELGLCSSVAEYMLSVPEDQYIEKTRRRGGKTGVAEEVRRGISSPRGETSV